MGEELTPADESPPETVPGASEKPGGHPVPVVVLMVFAGLAFVATAYIAIYSSASAVLGPVREVVIVSASLLIVAIIASRWIGKRVVAATCATLVMLACLGNIYAAVTASRIHDDRRERYRAGRQGPRIIELHTDQGREIALTMLVSIAASISTITALPLAGYFIVRAVRRRECEPPESIG